MKVLIADDEEPLAEALGEILKVEGYKVVIANNGEIALKHALNDNFEVVILDIMMPKLSGIEVVKEIRKRSIDVPILMLTARSDIEAKVVALDSGANDYLTKPFNKKELLARIRVISRSNRNNIKKIIIGNITLNKEESEIYTNKAAFHLNNKELQVMETLINNKGNKIGKEELRNRIWGNDENLDIVPMYVSFLQNKFRALDANVSILENNGYYIEEVMK